VKKASMACVPARRVAQVDALHAAAVQGLHFLRGVQVLADDLVVQLDLHRFQFEELAHVHAHEHRHLRAGGEEQFFFQHQQVAVQADQLGLEVLHARVQRSGGRQGSGAKSRSVGRAGRGCCRSRCSGCRWAWPEPPPFRPAPPPAGHGQHRPLGGGRGGSAASAGSSTASKVASTRRPGFGQIVATTWAVSSF
jgi:hypothetical protein